MWVERGSSKYFSIRYYSFSWSDISFLSDTIFHCPVRPLFNIYNSSHFALITMFFHQIFLLYLSLFLFRWEMPKIMRTSTRKNLSNGQGKINISKFVTSSSPLTDQGQNDNANQMDQFRPSNYTYKRHNGVRAFFHSLDEWPYPTMLGTFLVWKWRPPLLHEMYLNRHSGAPDNQLSIRRSTMSRIVEKSYEGNSEASWVTVDQVRD